MMFADLKFVFDRVDNAFKYKTLVKKNGGTCSFTMSTSVSVLVVADATAQSRNVSAAQEMDNVAIVTTKVRFCFVSKSKTSVDLVFDCLQKVQKNFVQIACTLTQMYFLVY